MSKECKIVMTNSILEENFNQKRFFSLNNPFTSNNCQFNKDSKHFCCNEIGGIE